MHEIGKLWQQVYPNAIWSGITLALTLLLAFAGKLRRYARRKRPYLRFYQKGTGNRLYIVPGSITYGHVKHVSSMSAGDIGALVELTGSLRTVYPDAQIERLISTDFPPGRLSSTIFAIGGPKNNTVMRQLFDEADTGYKFEGAELHSSHSNKVYKPEYDERGHPRIDYGLLAKLPNPYDSGQWFYAFSGCHTYGCLAAASLVSTFETASIKNLRSLYKLAHGKPSIIAIVRARVIDNSVAGISLIEATAFGEPGILRRILWSLEKRIHHAIPTTHWSALTS